MRLVPACLSASFLGLLLLWFIDGNFFYWSKNVATYGYTLLAMFFGAVLFQVMHEKRAVALSRCLRSQFMRQCGKYSYALYMVHVPVASLLYPAIFQALDKYGLNVNYEIGFLMFAFAAFAVSWLLSVASWHLFEKHILSLKRYFIYSPRAEAPSK